MRQPLQSGAFRAAIASLVAHALLLAAFLIAGPGQGPPAPASSIVEGEMVTTFEPPPAADTDVAEPAPPPREPAPTVPSTPAAEAPAKIGRAHV